MNPYGISNNAVPSVELLVWNARIQLSIDEYHRHPFEDRRLSPRTPATAPKPTTCMRTTCTRGPYRRGLCTVHYRHLLATRKANA